MKDRHAKIERTCEQCGNSFMARVERVNKGKGRFCSLMCANIFQKQVVQKGWGLENAKKYWMGGKWVAQWRDENGFHNMSFPKWWWLMNIGEIPNGYVVKLIDKNPENVDPSNFECVPKSHINKENAQYSFYTPRAIGPEERLKLSNRAGKNWAAGKYDKMKGETHPNWKGGKSKEQYPPEFYAIREFVLERDRYRCQICGKDLTNPKFAHVHHRDANKQHNDQNNLLSLCIHCHGQVHSNKPTSDVIMALRAELYQ